MDGISEDEVAVYEIIKGENGKDGIVMDENVKDEIVMNKNVENVVVEDEID